MRTKMCPAHPHHPHHHTRTQCFIILNDIQVGATATISNSLKPVWEDEVFDITLPEEGFDTCEVRVEIWDMDVTGKGSLLGQVVLTGPQLLGLDGETVGYNLVAKIEEVHKKKKKQNKYVGGLVKFAGSVRDPENCYSGIKPVHFIHKPTLVLKIVKAKGLKKAGEKGGGSLSLCKVCTRE